MGKSQKVHFLAFSSKNGTFWLPSQDKCAVAWFSLKLFWPKTTPDPRGPTPFGAKGAKRGRGAVVRYPRHHPHFWPNSRLGVSVFGVFSRKNTKNPSFGQKWGCGLRSFGPQVFFRFAKKQKGSPVGIRRLGALFNFFPSEKSIRSYHFGRIAYKNAFAFLYFGFLAPF